jgi:hypothetical protein
LALLLPFCLVPLLMHLVISRLIFILIKHKYLPKFLKELDNGWQTEQDKQAIKALSQLAAARLKYHFLFSYRIKEDLEAILLCIQNTYAPNQELTRLKLSFSIKKLVSCCLLGFCDLYKEYHEQPWFKVIKNVRLIWFWRLSALNRHWQNLFIRIPLLQKLRQTRLLGPLLRLLLVPLLGAPLLLWYVIRSISINIFYEGFFRFFYGLLLMKVGYYTIYLYGRENTIINQRIAAIPGKRIALISKDIELLLTEAFQTNKSKYFDKARTVYQTLLKEFEVDEDDKLSTDLLTADPSFVQALGKKISKILKNFLTNSREAYKKQNPFIIYEAQDKEKLLRLYYELGKIYFPKVKEPILMLRLTEAIEIGYMSSLLLLNFFLSTPGINMLLGNISVDFILKVKKLATSNRLRNAITSFNHSYKYVSVANKIYKIFRVAQGIVSPYQLVFTLSSPIIFQYVQQALRQFAYHKSGRLLLYGWESNCLKRTNRLTSLLWEF